MMKKLSLIAALALTSLTGCYSYQGAGAASPSTMGNPDPSWSPATETNFDAANDFGYTQQQQTEQTTRMNMQRDFNPPARVREVTECWRCN